MSKVQLKGRLVSQGTTSLKRFTTSIPVIELVNILEPEREYQGLEFFFEAARNKINKEQVAIIKRDIEWDLRTEGLEPLLSLTLVIAGKSNVEIARDIASVSYHRKQAIVVGNLLVFIAIMDLLSVKSPLFSSRLSSKDLEKNSVTRQALAIEDISLTVIFNEKGICDEQVRDLFFKFERQYTGVHLTQLKTQESNYPLKKWVCDLADKLNLDELGGVSSQSKHVKSKDKFVTTEYILFKVLVGAVANSLVQEKCRMGDNVTFNKGSLVSDILSKKGLKSLVVFFNAWLEPLRGQKSYHGGFRLSAQIWQALSLVVNQLMSIESTVEEIERAGKVLGQLDYGKKATHWKDCSVMELDSNGRLFKSAAPSSRDFKLGLYRYFTEIINTNTQLQKK